MPLSDEDSQRLERVYRQAASIRLARRVRLLALAVPLLLVGGGLVLASPDDSSKLQIAAASTTTSISEDVPELVPTTTTPPTTIAPPLTVPPTTTKAKVPPVSTPTTVAPPPAENCGGAFGQVDPPPRPPEGMEVTTAASSKTVRRGDVVELTLRANWTGSQPYTHSRGGRTHLLYAHLNGEIFYSNQYDPSVDQSAVAGDETFAPGETKTYSVRWDTSQACGPYGMTEATLRTGTYTIAAIWDSTSSTWTAEQFSFEITQ